MSSDYRPQKLFTLESANATLPLVRAIVTDIVGLAREIQERRRRLDVLLSGRTVRDPKAERDPYASELAEMERTSDQDLARLRELVEELTAIGAEAKDPLLGLVDFPSLLDGRVVYLCWKLGEPEIRHWHELDAGFSGRQPLALPPSDAGLSASGADRDGEA